MKSSFGWGIVSFLLLLSLGNAQDRRSSLKLHALFSDNMALQSDINCPVWGSAGPNEDISVSIAGQKRATKAGADGKWSLKLEPLKPGGPHNMTVTGASSITIHNILVGEVWICSGQSNMAMAVSSSNDSSREIGNARYSEIRLFTVPYKEAETPQSDVVGTWSVCSPETVANFSAVAYYFGRELHRELKLPVGLIHASVGGTPAEAWTSKETLESNQTLQPIFGAYARAFSDYEKKLAAFKEETTKGKGQKNPAPKVPRKPWSPSGLYNGMLSPLIPYGIRGAIWYQGESNAHNAKQYQVLLPAMIKNWRAEWGGGDFPFGIVQLANYMERKPQPAESNWAELREAQAMTLSTPKTGMATAIDVGDAKDIHPKDKQSVGKRLALWAESQVYGKNEIVYSGPIYDSMTIDGNKIRLAFTSVGGGIESKNGRPTGFSIAGEDRRFVWANAKIEGATIVVWSDDIANPVAVRYAWADNPECNIINKEGLPAPPFRTDDWPRKQ